MRIDLDGRIALVSASTGGIGEAIALGLAQAGARVAVNGRTAVSVGAAIERLQRAVPDGSFIATVGDVSMREGMEAALTAAGDVDVLVNNLGIYRPVAATEITDDEWEEMLRVNLLSGTRLAQRLLPQMTRKGWGRVLFISSDAGVSIPADMVHYGVSKAAVIAAARGLAKAVRATGVTVNSVIAGPTLTDGVREFIEAKLGGQHDWDAAEHEFMRSERPSSLLGRLIRPEEIANMVVYLASPLASATTGGAIRVDGGYVDSILP
jgi:hypothetical protein